VVSRDLNSFSQFAREVLINLPNVKDLHTSFSLGEVKASSALAVWGKLSEIKRPSC
jgi:Lrp/AsnC family leucine-responsive transcriptional regulator